MHRFQSESSITRLNVNFRSEIKIQPLFSPAMNNKFSIPYPILNTFSSKIRSFCSTMLSYETFFNPAKYFQSFLRTILQRPYTRVKR